MNKHFRFLGLTIICFLIAIAGYSASRIDVPDTVLFRGENNTIGLEVTGNIDADQADLIQIYFEYKSDVINIKSAHGDDSFAMKSADIYTEENFNPPDTIVLLVSDTKSQVVNNGTICRLNIEGLAGPDSIAYLKPLQLYINGALQPDTEFRTGQIKVLGAPIIPIPPEGVAQNYPNPFSETTRIIFYIKESTKIDFSLFSTGGEKIKSAWDNDPSIEFNFYDGRSGDKINPEKDEEFPPGEYELLLRPLTWKFGSGAYYLVMKTDNGTYQKTIMYTK